MTSKRIFKPIVALFATALIIITVSAIALAVPSPYTYAPRMRAGASNTSLNWGGYAVTGPTGSVSDAKGSWVVPAVTCPTTANQYSSFWVGIDGYTSNTVEQIGTDSDCINGVPTYYAWFEFYPKAAYFINSVNVKPGDVISAEVTYSGKQFTVTITDVTTSASFSISAVVKNAKRTSAEWIFEAPYSGGILPLANFSTAYFGYDSTGIASTNYATVGISTGPIGSFGSSVQKITMTTKSGAIKAEPSPLSADGTSFSAQWVSAGS